MREDGGARSKSLPGASSFPALVVETAEGTTRPCYSTPGSPLSAEPIRAAFIAIAYCVQLQGAYEPCYNIRSSKRLLCFNKIAHEQGARRQRQ
jgi:hypothetical protein